MDKPEFRKKIACLARKLIDKEISPKQFFQQFPDYSDPDVDVLEDLLEHEPSRGGLFGVSDSEADDYRRSILELIEKLETS